MAQHVGGIVVNADAMQVYRELPILTAQPSPAERLAVPHRLYGFRPAAEAYSVALWLDAAVAAIREAWTAGAVPIVAGGTGLYFKVLIEGLAPIPPIPGALRMALRARAATTPSSDLHAELERGDPATAARLAAGDTQRIVRALEVLHATGHPLSAWLGRAAPTPLPGARFERFVTLPPRAENYAAAEARFDAMLMQGALAEVAPLVARALDTTLPAMRALGVRELAAVVRGELALDCARAQVKQATRNYIKRQTTWLTRNMVDWEALPAQ